MTYSRKGKNFNTSRERKTRICVFLCAVKVNSFFIWPSLFSCNTKVNLNYCVGVKEKRPKKSCRNQHTEAVARRYSVKKMFLEMSQNSQENTCARISFLIKLQA